MNPPRCALVTGAASGIGRAIATGLCARGARVIGLDLKDAEITADLGTASGRATMAAQAAALSGGTLDAVFACAGILGGGAATVSVNYFGAMTALERLLPLLARSPAPRAVAIGSVAGYNNPDEALVAACLSEDESKTRALAQGRTELDIYSATKTALARKCRALAVSAQWAGQGVLLNVVAPGLVETGMSRETFANPARRAAVAAQMPCPLGRHAQAEEIASLALYLGGAENTFVTGQVIYADGGQEALQRGAAVI